MLPKLQRLMGIEKCWEGFFESEVQEATTYVRAQPACPTMLGLGLGGCYARDVWVLVP